MAGWSLDVTPSWLLPRSHWNDKARPAPLPFAMKFVNSGAAIPAIPAPAALPAFMLEYQCIVMGWIIWTGKFPEFDPVVEWVAQPRIAMSDPSDSQGWNHRVPEPYYMPIGNEKNFGELFKSY